MGVTRGRKEQLIFGDCSNEVKRQRGPDTMSSGQETKKSREKVVNRQREPEKDIQSQKRGSGSGRFYLNTKPSECNETCLCLAVLSSRSAPFKCLGREKWCDGEKEKGNH